MSRNGSRGGVEESLAGSGGIYQVPSPQSSERHSDAHESHDDDFMSVSDDSIVTFREIAEYLGEKANTISARWFPEKIIPLYEGLDCPPLFTSTGNRMKPTGFGAKAVIQYVQQCVRGKRSYESFKKEVQSLYPAKAQSIPAIDGELIEDDQITSSALAVINSRFSQKGEDRVIERSASLVHGSLEIQALEEELARIRQARIEEEALEEELRKKQMQEDERKARLKAAIKAELLMWQSSESSE